MTAIVRLTYLYRERGKLEKAMKYLKRRVRFAETDHSKALAYRQMAEICIPQIQASTYVAGRPFTAKEKKRLKKGLSYLKKANKLKPESLATLKMLERYYVFLITGTKSGKDMLSTRNMRKLLKKSLKIGFMTWLTNSLTLTVGYSLTVR